jgi:hypothetical protein
VGLVYDPRRLSGVTTARSGVAGVLHLRGEHASGFLPVCDTNRDAA